MSNKNHLLEIPAVFHSFHEEKPFDTCIECERNLLESGCEYLIEKVIRNYEAYKTQDVILDYAICMECAAKLHAQLSKESMMNIRQYFEKHVNLHRRAQRIAEAGQNVDQLIKRCMIKDTVASSSGEFQIQAFCVGNKISLENPPFMICSEVLEEVAELMSHETQGLQNDFFDRHFSPDPSLLAPLPRPKVVLI